MLQEPLVLQPAFANENPVPRQRGPTLSHLNTSDPGHSVLTSRSDAADDDGGWEVWQGIRLGVLVATSASPGE